MIKSPINIFAVTGFAVGLLFPAITLPLLLIKDDLPFTLDGLFLLHKSYANLWVVDISPLFLSLFLAFVEEKKEQNPREGPEQQLAQSMAGTYIIVSAVCFISLFLPGNEHVNLALLVLFASAFLGSLQYIYQPFWNGRFNLYLGGLAPSVVISLFMYGTGGVQSRYVFLLLIVLFFGVTFHGFQGLIVNGIYVILALLSPVLYTPFADFYYGYLLSTIPLFLLMGFVFFQSFELRQKEVALAESHKKLANAEKKAAVVTLARTAAHEIFNRLTPILGFAGILKKVPPSDPHFKQAIDQIQNQSREIEEIVNSMGELSPEETTTFGGVEIYDLTHKKEKSGPPG